jgi:hypothetical protein
MQWQRQALQGVRGMSARLTACASLRPWSCIVSDAGRWLMEIKKKGQNFEFEILSFLFTVITLGLLYPRFRHLLRQRCRVCWHAQ